jgi:hypothetical protein
MARTRRKRAGHWRLEMGIAAPRPGATAFLLTFSNFFLEAQGGPNMFLNMVNMVET